MGQLARLGSCLAILLISAWDGIAQDPGTMYAYTAPAPAAALRSEPAAPANPFADRALYASPRSRARDQARAWAAGRPEDAALLEAIARQPQAIWLGRWSGDITTETRRITQDAAKQGALPVLVAYDIPRRDCGPDEGAGAEGYRRWIRALAVGIGERPAAVILEPDALAGMDGCLDAAGQRARAALLREAAAILKEQPQTSVYIDAGNAQWRSAPDMARRLRDAGIAQADGFALNVSSTVGVEESARYGRAISAQLGGAPFVIDTSRSGRGPAPAEGMARWCNPRGRALGPAPTADTGDPKIHAYLWVKVPGESDGGCGRGDPAAGAWWPEYALELARNAEQDGLADRAGR